MGNISTAQLNAGMNIFQGIKKEIVVTNISSSVYNPATGAVGGSISAYVIKGLVCAYKSKEIAESGGLIMQLDKKVILMQKDIAGITVDENSTFTILGVIYRVISIFSGCDENTISVQIRK